jgi:two-component system phosphate regulon sensor histidine kinase PhoR
LVGLGLLVLLAAILARQWSCRCKTVRAMEHITTRLEQISQDQSGSCVLIDGMGGEAGDIAPAASTALSAVIKQVEELRRENHSLRIRGLICETQQHQVEQMLMSVSDAVFVTNRFDELTFANETAEQLLGFRLRDSKRKNIDEIVPDGALVRLLQDTRRLGLNHPVRVVEHAFNNGPVSFTFSISLRCLAGPNDTVAGVVAILHDITREKEIEQGKVEFIANVSHELKTPLASIKAYIEMLLDGEVQDPAGTRDFYQTISAEADRLHRMIERILAISRIESGSDRVTREPVSMTAVIKQVIKIIAPKAKAKNIDIEEHLAPVYLQVDADYDLLCQAVQNLLVNAIKYTPPGGHVVVDISADERRGVLAVEVSDTGVGIASDELPRVFEKFYRGQSTRKMASGSGLGLPLVKYIIEKVHGGRLSATSEPGRGSTFSFELALVS